MMRAGGQRFDTQQGRRGKKRKEEDVVTHKQKTDGTFEKMTRKHVKTNINHKSTA